MSRWHRFLVYFGLRRPWRPTGPPRVIDMTEAIMAIEPDTTPFLVLTQEAMWTAANRRLDSVSLINNAIGLISEPGATWQVDEPGAIRWLEDYDMPSVGWGGLWGDWTWA